MDRTITTINRIIITILCLVLCLAGTAVSAASAASRLSTSSRTALTACLQQEYLMRGTYQEVFAMYPVLKSFGTVAKDEIATIGTLTKVFAKYKVAVPVDTSVSAAHSIAQTATSVLTADAVAIILEQSTAALMTQLLSSADNQDVANAIALIKTTSLGSHTAAFTAEKSSVSTPVVVLPSAPVLSSPTSGSTTGSVTPTLVWSAATGASSYTVQVSLSSAFSTVISQSTTGPSVTTSSLTNATQYYCRVDATNAAGTSAWSSTSTFTTPAAAPTASVTRPFVAPVTTRIMTVPSSIDATGATNVSSALNAFVASVPDGSIIAFPSGATYRLDTGIQIANRHNLVFAGNGATLKVGPNASGSDQLASSFVLGHQYGGYWDNGNTDIVIHDFILIGNDTTPGTFTGGQEGQANLEITGTDRVEIYNVTGSAAPGDFAYISTVNKAWVHDCHVLTAGRNSISVIFGSDILVENCALDVSGYCMFDIEPNGANDACSNITFRSCTAKTWSNSFLSVEGSHTGASINGVVVDGNTVTGGSILTVIDNGGTARMKNVTFMNNKGGKAAAGPVLRFAHVDALTVTGTIQPLKSGVLANITDSTG